MEKTKRTIDVNGDTYERREVKPVTPTAGRMKSIALMAGLFGVRAGIKTNTSNKFQNLHIVDEFRKIDAFKKGLENKKSNLSKAERDHIIYQFNKHFVLTENQQ